MPGGYIGKGIQETVESAFNQRFGKAKWLIPGASETGLYFDRKALKNARNADGKPVDDEHVYAAAKGALLSAPQLHVSRVYSREQLDNGIEGDFIARAEMNGYYPRRSPDLSLVFEPGTSWAAAAARLIFRHTRMTATYRCCSWAPESNPDAMTRPSRQTTSRRHLPLCWPYKRPAVHPAAC